MVSQLLHPLIDASNDMFLSITFQKLCTHTNSISISPLSTYKLSFRHHKILHQVIKLQSFFENGRIQVKYSIVSARKWVVEHKLRTVGCLWLSGIAGSVAYNWSKPHMKTSVRIIHARPVSR
ncbi:hypothetical protein QQ045_013168 [Rhodiola kirilowii]